jgi:hypothetical protein
MRLHALVTALAATALVGAGIGACGSSSSGNPGGSGSSSGSSSGASGGSSGGGSGSSSGSSSGGGSGSSGSSGSSGGGGSSGGVDAGSGVSCTKYGGAACYVTGEPGYVCQSGETSVTSCPSGNEIGSCSFLTSARLPDGGVVTYSTTQYFYCTGLFSMTSASQLQPDCASSKGTWTSGSTVCGGDAASD